MPANDFGEPARPRRFRAARHYRSPRWRCGTRSQQRHVSPEL